MDLDQLIRDADPAADLRVEIPDPSRVRNPSEDRAQTRRRPGRLGAGILVLAGSVLAVAAVVAAVVVVAARPHNRQTLGPVCTSYRTTNIPKNSACMNLPWQLLEVGPAARSIWIKTAGGCFANRNGTGPAPT